MNNSVNFNCCESNVIEFTQLKLESQTKLNDELVLSVHQLKEHLKICEQDRNLCFNQHNLLNDVRSMINQIEFTLQSTETLTNTPMASHVQLPELISRSVSKIKGLIKQPKEKSIDNRLKNLI